MDPITLAVGAFITIAGGIIGFAKSRMQAANEEKTIGLAQDNLKLNEKTAQQNFELSQEQFDYQKKLNELTMQREDTAFQRQVADLKAAGLSPLNISGGSPASVLTSANAPQFDMSGINTAASNLIGAYNDYFTRKLDRQQFALQNKVQTAQAYTNLADLSLQRRKMNLENQYLTEKMKWEKVHGFRDLDWKSDLTKLIEDVLSGKGKEKDYPISIPDREEVSQKIDDILDTATYSDEENFADFGSVSSHTKYGHTLDKDNYDNNRSTKQLLKEEAKEKVYKIALKAKDTESNRVKLYNTDDYLKKHISEENWKKATKSFVEYYLKHGEFESHKKYF